MGHRRAAAPRSGRRSFREIMDANRYPGDVADWAVAAALFAFAVAATSATGLLLGGMR